MEDQLQCSNITCTTNSSLHFTKETAAECLAAGVASIGVHPRQDFEHTYPEYLKSLNSTTVAAGAGANAMLYNGMVSETFVVGHTFNLRSCVKILCVDPLGTSAIYLLWLV